MVSDYLTELVKNFNFRDTAPSGYAGQIHSYVMV